MARKEVASQRRTRDDDEVGARTRERWEVRRIDDAPAEAPRSDAGAKPPAEQSDETRAADGEAASRQRRRHWIIGGLVAALVLIGALWYGWHWFTTGRYLVETDDAYTAADSVTVSPQVAGTVAELLVTDNQRVRRGDVIARIDDRPFR